MGHLNGPYYPHALIQGVAYAHIILFDIPSLMHLRANYLALNMSWPMTSTWVLLRREMRR